MQAGRVATLTARTANGSSDVFAVPEGHVQCSIWVRVSASSGTITTFQPEVQWSHDGTNFAVADPADTFTNDTTPSSVVKQFATKAPFGRVNWVIAGTTPSVTFEVFIYLNRES